MAMAAVVVPRPQPIVPDPWVLSLAMLTVIALAWGAVRVLRRGGERLKGVLMLIAAAVLLGNVLIWAWI